MSAQTRVARLIRASEPRVQLQLGDMSWGAHPDLVSVTSEASDWLNLRIAGLWLVTRVMSVTEQCVYSLVIIRDKIRALEANWGLLEITSNKQDRARIQKVSLMCQKTFIFCIFRFFSCLEVERCQSQLWARQLDTQVSGLRCLVPVSSSCYCHCECHHVMSSCHQDTAQCLASVQMSRRC